MTVREEKIASRRNADAAVERDAAEDAFVFL
jgi:hypothetical protein